MAKTKVLSVVANPNERVENPNGYGLVETIERTIASFLEAEGGKEISYELAGTDIDSGAGSADRPQAVFGRTLIVLKYEENESGSKHEQKKKRR